jgi:hypothetical protein
MATQAERILAMLEEAGPDGVANVRLNQVSFRYSARIHTLRQEGHVILTKHIKGPIYNYIYVPPAKKSIRSRVARLIKK